MYPVLFQWGSFKVYSYGLMMALAFLSALGIVYWRAKKTGQNPDLYIEAIVWFIFSGLLGARLFYFIWYPAVFFQDPIAALLSQGGLVWYGGVIGALLASLVFARMKKIKWSVFADTFAPAAALGLAIGRIGCLLSGCCFGGHTGLPWAMTYPHWHETAGLPVHPSPLYESLTMIAVFFTLILLERAKPFTGFLMAVFFVCTGLTRFFVEYTRGDRLIWFQALDFSASQLISIGIVFSGLLLMIFYRQSASQFKKSYR
ncbi:MAG: prolipoprotein diacylglyceryl transferase [Cyanobacteria bacterium P01_H01_bin.74]